MASCHSTVVLLYNQGLQVLQDVTLGVASLAQQTNMAASNNNAVHQLINLQKRLSKVFQNLAR